MQSRIIGTFDPAQIPQDELQTILGFTGENTTYNEFRIGDWKTFIIRSSSGDDDDGLVSPDVGEARITPRGRALPRINEWIDRVFDTRKLRLARVHSLGDGVLVPHKDFIELGPDTPAWGRVHIPIQTNEQCLHSEEDTVFRMRLGEIWLFDASRLHSATNFSESRRLNLCLDFELGDAPVSTLFRDAGIGRNLPSPEIIRRPAMTTEFFEGLMSLASFIDQRNFRDIIGVLSKVHFYRHAALSQFFDWLLEITDRSGKPELMEKAIAFSTFLRAERSMSERFVL
jgi:hypothetical protein